MSSRRSISYFAPPMIGPWRVDAMANTSGTIKLDATGVRARLERLARTAVDPNRRSAILRIVDRRFEELGEE
jgi:hypothetical protein